MAASPMAYGPTEADFQRHLAPLCGRNDLSAALEPAGTPYGLNRLSSATQPIRMS